MTSTCSIQECSWSCQEESPEDHGERRRHGDIALYTYIIVIWVAAKSVTNFLSSGFLTLLEERVFSDYNNQVSRRNKPQVGQSKRRCQQFLWTCRPDARWCSSQSRALWQPKPYPVSKDACWSTVMECRKWIRTVKPWRALSDMIL